MLIISLYYGMTSTVLSLSYVWLIWFSTFSESPFYRWRIDRTVKQIAWGHTAVRARILNSIWLTVCPSHPWMAWAGWERWHLSGQCLLPGWPPSIVLRAGVFWSGWFWELLFPQWTVGMCPWLGVSKAQACEWGAGENPSLPAPLRRLGHHHLASGWSGSRSGESGPA